MVVTVLLACVCFYRCRANVEAFRTAHGIHATHVPIGFASNLNFAPQPPESEKDIDVLFFGTARCSPGCINTSLGSRDADCEGI